MTPTDKPLSELVAELDELEKERKAHAINEAAFVYSLTAAWPRLRGEILELLAVRKSQGDYNSLLAKAGRQTEAENTRLQARLELCERALEFYAARDSWQEVVHAETEDTLSEDDFDSFPKREGDFYAKDVGGKRARTALAESRRLSSSQSESEALGAEDTKE